LKTNTLTPGGETVKESAYVKKLPKPIFYFATGDCLPYCWMRKWEHIQTAGGVRQSNEYDENGCKVLCANDHSCQGIDWNVTGSSCWLLYEHRLILNPTSDPVHHWELEKNLPTVCSSGKLTIQF